MIFSNSDINKFGKACGDGNQKAVQKYLDAGMDVNAFNKGKRPPIVMAAHNRRIGIVNLLIEKKADVNLLDEDGFSALILAAMNNYPDVVKSLLEAKADINATIKSVNGGYSSLMYAAMYDRIDMVNLLLEYNPEIDKKDAVGRTALSWAKKLNIIQALLNHGAKVDNVDEQSETPLTRTIVLNNQDPVEEVKLLIKYGANIHHIGGNEYTPLFRAIQYNHLEVTRILILSGANLNHRLSNGMGILDIPTTPEVTTLLHSFLKDDEI